MPRQTIPKMVTDTFFSNYNLLKMVSVTILFLSIAANTAHADLRNGLVGWWKMDEASGSTVYDSSGNNYTATASGTTIVSNCKRNRCRSFDGTNDYIDAGSGFSTFGAQLNKTSYSYWVKTTSTSLMSAAGTFNTGANTAFQILVNSNESAANVSGKMECFARSDGGNGISYANVNAVGVNDGDWHHVVCVIDGSSGSGLLYYDGVSQSVAYQINSVFGATSSFTYNTMIGARNNRGTIDLRFSGSLDDFRMYNRLLTAQEVGDLYRAGIQLRNGVVRNGRINK